MQARLCTGSFLDFFPFSCRWLCYFLLSTLDIGENMLRWYFLYRNLSELSLFILSVKKREKNPESCQNRTRKFSAKWQVGRLWLQYDYDKGMICEWCIENKQTLVAQNVSNSIKFIDGCNSHKAESVSYGNAIELAYSPQNSSKSSWGGGGGTFERLKTNPGECILGVTRPIGECSQN